MVHRKGRCVFCSPAGNGLALSKISLDDIAGIGIFEHNLLKESIQGEKWRKSMVAQVSIPKGETFEWGVGEIQKRGSVGDTK